VATPIGHGLVGFTCVLTTSKLDRRAGRAAVVVALVFSIAPDFDFLPGILLGKPALYHQGPSHSLVVALVGALLAALIIRFRGWSLTRRFWLIFLAYASHIFIDCLGPDNREPYGLPLFWPFSSAHFQSPIPLLPGVHHVVRTDASTGEWLRALVDWHNVRAIGIEVLVGSTLIVLVGLLRWWCRRRQAA